MYIERTTAAERLIIERALDGIFIRLDRAYDLLLEVIDTNFGDFEKKPIAAHDAEAIATRLEVVEDIVFDSILAYSLTVGCGNFRGVAPYLESAERAALAAKVERQLNATFPGVNGTERRKWIMNLPDEQATAIMEKEMNVDDD